eukprot:3655765-Pleurochrysis_carterae.AAC.2
MERQSEYRNSESESKGEEIEEGQKKGEQRERRKGGGMRQKRKKIGTWMNDLVMEEEIEKWREGMNNGGRE